MNNFQDDKDYIRKPNFSCIHKLGFLWTFLGLGYLFTGFPNVLVNRQIFKDLRFPFSFACCILIRCGQRLHGCGCIGTKGAGIPFPDNGRVPHII